MMRDDKRSVFRRAQPSTVSSSEILPLTRPSAPPRSGNSFPITQRENNTDSSAKRKFKVQVPTRMLNYTLLVFVGLPATLFIWKELHLHNPEESHYKQEKYRPVDAKDVFPFIAQSLQSNSLSNNPKNQTSIDISNSQKAKIILQDDDDVKDTRDEKTNSIPLPQNEKNSTQAGASPVAPPPSATQDNDSQNSISENNVPAKSPSILSEAFESDANDMNDMQNDT